MTEIQNNQIVLLRRGNIGCVDSFNNNPHTLIFNTFTILASNYSGTSHKKKTDYDIVAIYDGSAIENIADIFKKGYSVDNLTPIWKEDDK